MSPMEKYNNENIEGKTMDKDKYLPGILAAAYSSVILLVNTNWDFFNGLEKIIAQTLKILFTL